MTIYVNPKNNMIISSRYLIYDKQIAEYIFLKIVDICDEYNVKVINIEHKFGLNKNYVLFEYLDIN